MLFNSSQDVESEIVSSDLPHPKMGLNLDHHSEMNRNFINVYEGLGSEAGKAELLRMLLFELRRQYSTQ